MGFLLSLYPQHAPPDILKLCVELLLPCWMALFWAASLGFLKHPLNVTEHSCLGKGLCFYFSTMLNHLLCFASNTTSAAARVFSIVPPCHTFVLFPPLHLRPSQAFFNDTVLFTVGPYCKITQLLQTTSIGRAEKHLSDAVLRHLMPYICKTSNFRHYTLEFNRQWKTNL